MSKVGFRAFLTEREKQVVTFSDVIDDDESTGEDEVEDEECIAPKEKERYTGKQNKKALSPSKTRKWMELSNTGD